MYRFKATKYKVILASMVLALLFNSVGTLFAASSLLNQAKSFANQDVELICTGSSFKWMSISVYQQTGEIKYVDAPENAPSGFDNIKCSYSYLNDNHSDQTLLGDIPSISVSITTNEIVDYLNAEYLARKHQLAFSRAPPTNMFISA